MKRRTLSLFLTLTILLGMIPITAINVSAATTVSISTPKDDTFYSWDDAPRYIKWNSVSGATGYYVKVLNNTTSIAMYDNEYTTSTKFYVDFPKKNAVYKIWVGAVYSKSDAPVSAFSSDIIWLTISHEPDVTLIGSESITNKGATLKMSVDKDYGAEMVDSGFYIGTSSTISRMTKYSFDDYGSYSATSKGTKTMTISDLEPGTKYYFRAYAENLVGEEYTSYSSFTTKSSTSGSLSVSSTSVSMAWGSGNDTSVTVTCGGTYSVSSPDYDVPNSIVGSNYNYDWLNVSKSGNTIRFTPNRANYSASARSATVTVSYGSQSKDITVTQRACGETAPKLTLKRDVTYSNRDDIGTFALPQTDMEINIYSQTNVRRLIAELWKKGAISGEPIETCADALAEGKIHFDISNLSAGEYEIRVNTSNSATENDYYKQTAFSDEPFVLYFGVTGGNTGNISITGITVPSPSYTQGGAFNLTGTITSTYPLSIVTVRVIKASNGEVVVSKSRSNINTTAYNIKSTINYDVPFSTISSGTYYLEYEATDSKGNKEIERSESFTISSGHVHSFGTTVYYEAEHPHKGYKLCSCGHAEYTGTTRKIEECTECYPSGGGAGNESAPSIPSSFDEAKAMVDFPTSVMGVTKGRIRYMTQLTIDSNYVVGFWNCTVNGEPKTINSSDKCTRCALSMALSYLGLDYTPGLMSTLLNSAGIDSPLVEVPEKINEIDKVRGNFDTLYNNYCSSTQYSPIVMYFKHINSNGHAIVVVGRNGDTYYAVDPAANVTKLVEFTFNKSKAAIASCSYAIYANTSSIIGFSQWKLTGEDTDDEAKFAITSPVNNSEVTVTAEGLNVTWSSVKDATAYCVRIRDLTDNPDGDKPDGQYYVFKEDLSDLSHPEFTIRHLIWDNIDGNDPHNNGPFQDGHQYRVWVGALDDYGNSIAASEAVTITVHYKKFVIMHGEEEMFPGNSYEMYNGASKMNLQISSVCSWQIASYTGSGPTQEDADWFSVSPVRGEAGTTNVKISIPNGITDGKRVGTIRFTTSDGDEYLMHIYQEMKNSSMGIDGDKEWFVNLTENGQFTDLEKSFNTVAKDMILAEKQDYVLRALKWYIKNYLDSKNQHRIAGNIAGEYGGGNGIFFFDGCGSYLHDARMVPSGFIRPNESVRRNVSAVCIVVRQNLSGHAEIVYCTDMAATMPDNVRCIAQSAEKQGMPIVIDGIYSISSVNHGYAAVNLDGKPNAIRFDENRSFADTASGIHIHTAYTEDDYLHMCCSTSTSSPDSNGCLTIGTAREHKDVYNDFIKAVYSSNSLEAIVDYNSHKYQTVTQGKDLGCAIIDRTCYLDNLAVIYGDDTETGGIAGTQIATGKFIASTITADSIEWREAIMGSNDPIVKLWDEYATTSSQDTPGALTTVLTVSYKAFDDGTDYWKLDSMQITAGQSATFTIIDQTPTKAGYSFLGWSDSPDATTAKYKGGETLTTSTGETLYAVWKNNSPDVGGGDTTYTISGSVTSFGTGSVTIKLLDGSGKTVTSTTTSSTSYKLSADKGTYSLEVSQEGCVTRTYAVSVTTKSIVQDVRITVLGDMTGDGKINNTDVLRLMKYIKAKGKGVEIFVNADINGDGKINNTDALRLMKYVKAKGQGVVIY